MRGKAAPAASRGVELVNLQKRYVLPRAALAVFARDLRRRLRLGTRQFNICFVDDHAIRHLNLAHRGRDKPTDVLSFPWAETESAPHSRPSASSRVRQPEGIRNFLGDVVISVQTAARNARHEGHSTLNEIRWLILHGVLHLLGYDHEHDSGQMMALELELREQLRVAEGGRAVRKSKGKVQKAIVKGELR